MTTEQAKLEKILYNFCSHYDPKLDKPNSELHQATIQAIKQLIVEGKVQELSRIAKRHRAFIAWGDGASSDLDKYLDNRIKELKQTN